VLPLSYTHSINERREALLAAIAARTHAKRGSILEAVRRYEAGELSYLDAVLKLAQVDGSGALAQADSAVIRIAMAILDRSELLPIDGQFDATQRAIRRLANCHFGFVDDYIRAIDREVDRIVNSLR
jgi:hypothetical protein